MNDPAWKVTVRDLGPIASGSVTLAPLTVFVGPNNAGKSYMASLLWTIMAGPPRPPILGWLKPDPGSQAAERAWDLARKVRHGEVTVIGEEQWRTLVLWMNDWMKREGEAAFRASLSHPDLNVGSIDVEVTDLPRAVRVKVFETSDPAGSTPPPIAGLPASFRVEDRVDEVRFFAHNLAGKEDQGIIAAILTDLAGRLAPRYGNPLYIPAARTGLMLAWKDLVAGRLEMTRREAADASTLPGTIRRFLSRLVHTDAQPGSRTFEIARFIEEHILEGNVSKSDLGELLYSPHRINTPLPLRLTSSLVTEIAPFVALLKAGVPERCIVFEEPEAHLHLSAQRALARALIRLVNDGKAVLVTTHSDTFLQQINILMQLHGHPDRDALAKEFGYEQADILDPAKARGYSFDRIDGRTRISELRKNPEGFVEPLMNAQIDELTSEVIRMEQA